MYGELPILFPLFEYTLIPLEESITPLNLAYQQGWSLTSGATIA